MDPELLAEAQRRGLVPPSTPASGDSAVDPELLAEAQRRGLAPSSVPSPTAAASTPPAAPPSLFRRIWSAASIPENMSRQGLNAIAGNLQAHFPEAEPTGNLPRDLALNTPKILATSAAETAAKVAPGFVSPLAAAAEGGLTALRAAAPVGRALGRMAEGWSGLEYKTPGVLAAAANDSGLLFGPGRDNAGAIYDAATNRGNIAPEIREAMTHEEVVKNAEKVLKSGAITPDEALVARQSLDAIRKSMPVGRFQELRDGFDAVAKNISAEADAAYQRALQSEALQKLAPVNKGGGTSIAKTAIATLLGKPWMVGAVPAVQGAVATGVGAAARNASTVGQAVGAAPAVAQIPGAYSSVFRRLTGRQ